MLKIVFGLVGLVIVLAMVSSLAKTQLGAIGQIGQGAMRWLSPDTATDSAATVGSQAPKAVGAKRLDGFAATAGAEMPTVPQQAQGVQQSVFERTDSALQQSVQRYKRADP